MGLGAGPGGSAGRPMGHPQRLPGSPWRLQWGVGRGGAGRQGLPSLVPPGCAPASGLRMEQARGWGCLASAGRSRNLGLVGLEPDSQQWLGL